MSCPEVLDAFCDGDVAVQYAAGEGACLGGACTYDSAEEDCLIAGDRCVGGACETPADLCATLTCPALAPACDGNSVVTTTGAGTCDNAFPGCDYSAVSVTTPCTGTETCFEGACVRGPLPGDLVLSEIFYDGSGSDVAQEWFEFVNVSDDTIALEGLEAISASGLGFRFPAADLAPGSIFLAAADGAPVGAADLPLRRPDLQLPGQRRAGRAAVERRRDRRGERRRGRRMARRAQRGAAARRRERGRRREQQLVRLVPRDLGVRRRLWRHRNTWRGQRLLPLANRGGRQSALAAGCV